MMLRATPTASAAAAAPARTAMRLAPGRPSPGRLAARAYPEPPRGPQGAQQTEEGRQRPTKDVTDTAAPTSLREVGDAVREATPHMAKPFMAPLLLPTFSRRREVFAGRLAMLGFTAACVWEIVTPGHLGPMAITTSLTDLSAPTVKLLYGALITHGVLGLVWPGAPTFDSDNVRDYMRRPEGPPRVAVSPLGNPARFFGCSPNWGFTKKNELFVGRLAMLGFLAAIVNEAQTGLGPVGQVAWWLGSVQPGNDWYRSAAVALLGFTAVAAGLAYATGHGGTLEGESDTY